MKSKLLLLLFSGLTFSAIAQNGSVGIGTKTPDNSAILDLSSSKKGILIPRMTLAERNQISNPALGLKIYQIDGFPGEYSFDGNKWNKILTDNEAKSVALDVQNWSKTGDAGTNPSINFIGTTDLVPLKFRVNNLPSGLIDPSSENVAFGYNALTSPSIGFSNLAFGSLSQGGLTNSGNYNTSVGNATLLSNTTGSNNAAIGTNALRGNITGNANTAVGANAMQLATGNTNVAIGANAGFTNSGDGSVFIGFGAGTFEGGSNKLYIANSNTDMPLVYGDFSAKYVTIGDVSPTLRNQGTASGGYNLLVKGGILTEKVKVALAQPGSDWADYVFDKSYKLRPLGEVESFINKNKHLPGVPTTKEMMENGNDLIKTDAKLLEKIEELTLYIIKLDKEIQKLKAKK